MNDKTDNNLNDTAEKIEVDEDEFEEHELIELWNVYDPNEREKIEQQIFDMNAEIEGMMEFILAPFFKEIPIYAESEVKQYLSKVKDDFFELPNQEELEYDKKYMKRYRREDETCVILFKDREPQLSFERKVYEIEPMKNNSLNIDYRKEKNIINRQFALCNSFEEVKDFLMAQLEGKEDEKWN